MDFGKLYEVSAMHGTLVSRDRAEVLYTEALSCSRLDGEFWECGVYKGGSARILAEVIAGTHERALRLFDTFMGLPVASAFDTHKEGEFRSEEAECLAFVNFPFVSVHKGLIPKSFEPFVDRPIAFAHLDLDLYQSTKDALEFVYHRLLPGGSIVIDDYEWDGDIGCPGVKKAVDESGLPAVRKVNFQAVISKCHSKESN